MIFVPAKKVVLQSPNKLSFKTIFAPRSTSCDGSLHRDADVCAAMTLALRVCFSWTELGVAALPGTRRGLNVASGQKPVSGHQPTSLA